MPVAAHIFAFSTNWQDGKRLCQECSLKYDDGEHIEIHPLKPYTSYICPSDDDGVSHSSTWSGSQDTPELRKPRDKFCVCGAEFVEEDKETWRLSWEMQEPPGSPWRTISVIRTRHAAESQRDGLLELAAQGELIRAVSLTQLAEAAIEVAW